MAEFKIEFLIYLQLCEFKIKVERPMESTD